MPVPRRPGATIEEVARAAGVSRQTVSNALNAPDRVRQETLTRVLDAIERLGYQPDQSARALRTGQRRTIGYCAPVDDPFDPNPLMAGFLEALVDAAGAEGYRVLLFRPPPGTDDPRPAIDELLAARQVDGLVLADVLSGDPRVQHVVRAGVPFAAFGRTDPGTPQHWVDIDNARATAEAVAHLAALGHRRIAYLDSPAEPPWLRDRREGFQHAAAAHRLDRAPILRAAPDNDPAETVRRIGALLRGPDRPTAVVAATDLLALSCYEAIRTEGRAVGGDVAVVGFHDLPIGRRLHPPLSSVRLPLPAIASALMRLLLAQLRGQPTDREGVLLPGELVIRASSC